MDANEKIRNKIMPQASPMPLVAVECVEIEKEGTGRIQVAKADLDRYTKMGFKQCKEQGHCPVPGDAHPMNMAPATAETEKPKEPETFEDMSLAQLKDLAAENGLTPKEAKAINTKDEIIIWLEAKGINLKS